MSIHPRALIHPDARIGKECVIGPDVIIDQNVVIGDRCDIRARAILTGHTTLGDDNQIGYQSILGAEPQDLSYRGAATRLVIGHRNTIRENVTIHRGTAEGSETRLGDDNYLMAGSHVAHNCTLGNHIILVNNVLLGGYVEVHDFAFVGGDVVAHQFVRIGCYVMVRGQTRLGMDVPPYAMAAFTNTVCGLNLVGLKRRGFDAKRRRRIREAFDLIYHRGLNRLQALEALRALPRSEPDDLAPLISFLDQTRRGFCRFGKADSKEE
ncbi:MAG: acyl-ACP--UDP-N-acetylglucosamine O-acyltransferase [Candidatus Methylacidiphilales bacterium]